MSNYNEEIDLNESQENEQLNAINQKHLYNENLQIEQNKIMKPLKYKIDSSEKIITILIWLSGFFLLQGFITLQYKSSLFLILGVIIFITILYLIFKNKSQYIINQIVDFTNTSLTYSIFGNLSYYSYKYTSYYLESWYIIKMVLIIIFSIFIILSFITPIVKIISTITNNIYETIASFKFIK